MGFMNQLVDQALRARIHPERVQFQTPGLFIEQTQHDALAVAGGNRGNANIDGATGNAQ